MRSHPRIRKSVKWAGAALTVTLVSLWVISWRTAFVWRDAPSVPNQEWRLQFLLTSGRVWIGYESLYTSRPWPSGWTVSQERITIDWTPTWQRRPWYRGVAIPLWAFFLPSAVATALAYWLDLLSQWRAKLGACSSCGYTCAGLPESAPCPECGKPRTVPVEGAN